MTPQLGGVICRCMTTKTIHVSLPEELSGFVERTVKGGRYHDASEVVREALRLLEEHDRFRAQRLAAFRTAIDERLDRAEFDEALEAYRAAAELIPEPKEDWEASCRATEANTRWEPLVEQPQ